MAQFQFADLGAARGRGIQNALGMMQVQQGAKQLRDQRQMDDIRANSPDMNALASNLQAAGYGEKANALRSQMIDTELKGLEYIAKTVPFANDQQSYENLLFDWQERGLVNPGELPDQYDPDLLARLGGDAVKKIEQFGAFEQIPGMEPGTMGQKSSTTGKYANVKTPDKDKDGGKGDGLKSHEITAMERHMARYFPDDALYDANGQFIGFKQRSTRGVDINKRLTAAARLKRDNPKMTPQEAVDKSLEGTGLLGAEKPGGGEGGKSGSSVRDYLQRNGYNTGGL